MSTSSDYFAAASLDRADTLPPLEAMYAAQASSREAGFDFADISQVLERAVDEVRETQEAYDDWRVSDDAAMQMHFADEVADIVFSIVNLLRWRGIDASTLAGQPHDSIVADLSAALADIASMLHAIAEAPLPQARVQAATAYGVCLSILAAFKFDANRCLRTNVKKYLRRCAAIESLAAQEGKSWADLAAANEIITYWQRAKTQ